MSLYLYALLGEAPRRPLGRGLGGDPLRVVPAAGLFVAAGELAAAPSPGAAALRSHDAAVRRLARSVDALLPVRFGALVTDESSLTRLLEPRAAELRDALALVAGRVQMTLRVYGKTARRPAPPGEAEQPGTGPGTGYLARRRLARLRRQSVPEIVALRPALAAFVRAERVERHDTPPLLASVYHLVQRGQVGAYTATLERAVRVLDGVRVRASGPWPPYAFAPEALA